MLIIDSHEQNFDDALSHIDPFTYLESLKKTTLKAELEDKPTVVELKRGIVFVSTSLDG